MYHALKYKKKSKFESKPEDTQYEAIEDLCQKMFAVDNIEIK